MRVAMCLQMQTNGLLYAIITWFLYSLFSEGKSWVVPYCPYSCILPSSVMNSRPPPSPGLQQGRHALTRGALQDARCLGRWLHACRWVRPVCDHSLYSPRSPAVRTPPLLSHGHSHPLATQLTVTWACITHHTTTTHHTSLTTAGRS